MTSATPDIDALYAAHFDELVEIATREFGIPISAAEQLAYDVFLSAIRPLVKMTEPHCWLVAAMKFAARHHNDRTGSAGQSVHGHINGLRLTQGLE